MPLRFATPSNGSAGVINYTPALVLWTTTKTQEPHENYTLLLMER